MRLNKYLASAGVASRRRSDALIGSGEVVVNGKVVTEPWLEVEPGRDSVVVGGNAVETPQGHSYLLLHKPGGVITTVSDPHGRRTVIDLLGSAAGDRRLFPVGRLDADTTGALLLTDDGELAFRLTHPRFSIRKEFVVELQRPLAGVDLARLSAGPVLEEGPVCPDEVRREAGDRVVIVLHAGRKRVVRRMMAALDHEVRHLHRRRFAGISADSMPRGGWRELGLEETNELRGLVDLDPIVKKES